MTDTTEDVETNALTADPVVEAPEAVIEEPQQSEPVEGAEQQSEPEAKPHHLKGKTPWYMERINEETNQKRLLQEQLAQKAREAEESRQLLERLQNGDKTPAPKAVEQDIDALVEAKAAQKLFQRDLEAVKSKARAEFGAEGFNEMAAILGATGAASEEFLQDVIAVDKANAHKILDILAKDPERARSLSNMDLRQRTAELTRISDKMTDAPKPAAPTPRTGISKVPPPKPVVEAATDDFGEMDLRNPKLSDDQYSKIWDAKYLNKKRA